MLLDVPFIPQERSNTCLISCAAMALAVAGDAAKPLEVWQSVKMWNDGTTFLEIAGAARARGRLALTVEATEEQLATLLGLGVAPVVAVDRGGKHGVVVRGYLPATRSFLVLDPARGEEDVAAERLAREREPYRLQTLLIARDQAWLARAQRAELPVDVWLLQDASYRNQPDRQAW